MMDNMDLFLFADCTHLKDLPIWDLLVRLRDTENVNIIASTEDL